jgi:hypothetical protein
MPVNVDLLQKVLDYITEHPAEWDQGYYARKTRKSPCGTAACVAGHTVAMTGHVLNWDGRQVFTCDTTKDDVWNVAELELGLTFDEADELFDPDNTLADLWLRAAEFTDGAIEIPAGVVA